MEKNDAQGSGWNINKAAVDTYNAEYSPEEAFLMCFIDGSRPAEFVTDSRETRLAKALAAVFGQKRPRTDDPTEIDGRALFRMAQLAHEDYVAQLKPEFGGPPPDAPNDPERTPGELAREVRGEMGLGEEHQDRLQRKFSDTYAGRPKDFLYKGLPISRECEFDASAENEMAADFATIGEILAKYGIQIDCHRVFWRTHNAVT